MTLSAPADPSLSVPDDVFRIAFERSAVGLLVADASGDYVHANQGFCGFAGYAQDELARMSLDALIPAEDVPGVRLLADKMLRGDMSVTRWEQRYVHKSGADLWALQTTTLVRDAAGAPSYFISQVVDIGDRKQAELALQGAEARARALIGALQDVIIVLDADGTYTDIAASATDRLLRPPPELIGRRLHDVFSREQADAFLGYVRRALETGTPVECTYELDIRDDHYWFDATVSPLPDGRVVWVARDVTARTRAEIALRESEDQLRQAQKMEAVGQLAGGIAHDFNNLLMAIMSNAELAALELSGASEVAMHIEEIRSASRRARSLTQQLLAFSRKQMLQPRVLDLNDVVRESEQMLRRLIGETITMAVALDPGIGAVRADPGQIGQVLMNLVVNARDAMPDGGQLTIESFNRDMDAGDARMHRGLHPGSYAAVQVRDTGVGMDEETRARIFEPFFTTKAAGQGTGLGLSTVYGIVKQSGGYVAVDSRPGAGTTVTVFLPRVADPAGENAPAPSPGPVSGPEPTLGTVLLVEDEAAVREATRRMLRKFGFRVIEAKHGRDALLLWEQEGRGVDIVLTDVVMPAMGGAELVRTLRERRPDLRVVFMSGYTQGTLEMSSMDESATRFLPKPFTADQLVGTLRELLNDPGEPAP